MNIFALRNQIYNLYEIYSFFMLFKEGIIFISIIIMLIFQQILLLSIL